MFHDIYADFNERLKAPDGFFLDVPPRQRIFPTNTGKANFLVLDGLHADVPVDDPQMLRLLTVRSQDQFNTTIYSMNDRYRGVWGNRIVLFMNPEDRKARGLAKEQVIGLQTIYDDGHMRMVSGLTVLDYPLPRGAVAGYYPELNPLIPIEFVDFLSGTPAAKSVPVRVITLPGSV